MHKTVVFRTVVPLRADYPNDNTEYGFYFDVIDSSLVGEPEERASAAKHKIKVGITYELLTNWRLDNASEDDLVRILFHYARRYVEQKIKDGTLTNYEELLLSTEEHREGDCPLDISRIPDPVGFTADIAVDYALEKLVKLIPESPALAQPMKEQPEQIQKDFFISYNSVDHQWAEWIAWQLEEAGYTTVLQAWDFRPGSNFVLEMQRAAKEVERTIAVLSQAYLDALYTQSEWAAAFARDPTGEKGTLLPVRVQECDLEGLLPQIVYIDLVGLDEAASRDALLTGVRRERAKPTVAPGFPGVAPRSVPERPRFPETPSLGTMPIPSLAIGEWVQWGGLALSVTRYETTYTCPGGYGRSAEGAKFVIIQMAARNVSNDVIKVTSLSFKLDGYQSGLTGTPCRYNKEAFGNACWQWSGKLYPDVMCEGWVLFEVPEKLALGEARVRISGRKFGGELDIAEWRLEGE